MAGKKGFNWKGWTSLFTLFSFIIDTVSGIVLYISPPGRIANWTNWNIWGLTKEEWGAIHTIFGYVLLIIICFHIYNNWKIFWNYLWSRAQKVVNLKKELAAAAVVSILVFAGTLWEIPPFSSTMELGATLKESWEENKTETPTAHAELLSVEKFGQTIDVPADRILSILKEKGIAVENTRQTIRDIAEKNNMSPNALYEAIKAGGAKPKVSKFKEGSGMGKKSLAAICEEAGIPLSDALSRLKAKGVDAGAEDKLKDVAVKLGLTPMEIIQVLSGEK